MSTMKRNRKPPLAKSPVPTRPRRALRNLTSTFVQTPSGAANKSPLFECGRFYDAYSARRNESLKKPKSQCDLGVAAGTVDRGGSKRLESGSKSGAVDFQVDRSQHPRYSLRSTKENKKPPLSMSFDKPHKVKKTGTVKKI
uniref:Uncharacterized protein n=1 Tax=Kalanchoe fedtschenkoi TaxID=63787 RepID=A0A7N0UHJ0_KALFE